MASGSGRAPPRSESTPLLGSSGGDGALQRARRNHSALSIGSLSEGPYGISPIISETDDRITLRQPIRYYGVNRSPVEDGHDERTRATINRYKYYSKLAPHSASILIMPNHIVPPSFFYFIPIEIEAGKQSSIITIFSVWNTMMGTSLLSMPWAIQQAGFVCGLLIIILMAGLTLYTAYRVLKSPTYSGLPEDVLEFTDVCQSYFGRLGKSVSVLFSLIALLGAAVVYWVLMTNFLYHTVSFVYDKVNNEFNTSSAIVIGNYTFNDVLCPHRDHVTPTTTTPHPLLYDPTNTLPTTTETPGNHNHLFNLIWQQTRTVPFFLVILILPLLNFKSPTFFTKFNALGTLSVVYITIFVVYKAAHWGINVDFKPGDPGSVGFFHMTFPALTGTLSLAFFIHNCIISIVRNQKNPENNGRDLSIAYVCVACTYMIIGTLFYISFPLSKDCIQDNLLDNLQSSDILTFVARIFLFFQMVTVFPLLAYIMRVQFMHTVFNSVYPSLKHVLGLNGLLVTVCLLFAVFLPRIGVIIRFSGALCGLAYIFTLPCLVYMYHRKLEGTLTWPCIILHGSIIFVGVLNFVSQFVIIFVK